RYSALTVFGLLPAALIGAELDGLLKQAAEAAAACRQPDPAENPGAFLGAVLGEAAIAGRDKATFVGTTQTPFGAWAEQLLAESTGKEGKGVVPVDGEAAGPAEVYGDDRLFLTIGDENRLRPFVSLPDVRRYALGDAFFTFEFATAVAGHVLTIQPFDQPNVQEAKDRTAEALESDEAGVQTLTPLDELLDGIRPGDYVAIQAFVPSRSDLLARLQQVRLRIRDRFRVATTLGLGPRYLHSTGQLHKGGPDTGVFMQVFGDPVEDRAVPGQPYTFGSLIAAQAAGDLAALRDRGRRAGRVRLDELVAWGG
ncbi:MAG TPA: glucose-6-phosphate isomerase, partial [Actinomycetota bacterium]|nr:glucose-6-phosphate isomerase [Actinomycetota bacterium]